MTVWRIDLPITKPLSMNDREHWATKAKRVREVREWVARNARSLGIPEMDRMYVELHYSPRDRRRRDVENVVPTQKACVDALVEAGIVPDDTADYYEPIMPLLDPPNGKCGRLYLYVSDKPITASARYTAS